MAYHINFKFILLVITCFGVFAINSCNDIINMDNNVKKNWINMTPQDSLNQLFFKNIDFGDVRYGSVNIDSIEIFNQSANEVIEIYSMTSTNPSNLFTYTFEKGMPFTILSLENTKATGKIIVKFYAQSFYFKEYTDTLVLNNNENYKVIIRANVKSF